MSLGIALLGTGRIADHAFAPAVQATDGAQLVAVLSRDQRRGAAFAQRHAIPAVYDDLATLLRSPQVDAVIVATPDATHEPQVIAAAMCEAPQPRKGTTRPSGCCSNTPHLVPAHGPEAALLAEAGTGAAHVAPVRDCLPLDPEEFRRRPTENLDPVLVAEPGNRHDVVDWGDVPRERVIGPQDHVIDPRLGDQVPHALASEHDRIEIQLS